MEQKDFKMSKEKIEKQAIEELADAIYTNCPACLLTEEAEMIARFVVEEQGYRKQKEGEWIIQGLANPKCSVCNHYTRGDSGAFCPNCGAHMRGGKNE